jgi:hypothetical protein
LMKITPKLCSDEHVLLPPTRSIRVLTPAHP